MSSFQPLFPNPGMLHGDGTWLFALHPLLLWGDLYQAAPMGAVAAEGASGSLRMMDGMKGWDEGPGMDQHQASDTG